MVLVTIPMWTFLSFHEQFLVPRKPDWCSVISVCFAINRPLKTIPSTSIEQNIFQFEDWEQEFNIPIPEGHSKGNAHPIGRKKGNGFGLYDMSGNLWEWCFYTSETPNHICQGLNFRGSSFASSISYRCREYASYRGSSTGIRFVRYDY